MGRRRVSLVCGFRLVASVPARERDARHVQVEQELIVRFSLSRAGATSREAFDKMDRIGGLLLPHAKCAPSSRMSPSFGPGTTVKSLHRPQQKSLRQAAQGSSLTNCRLGEEGGGDGLTVVGGTTNMVYGHSPRRI
ncbi:hypothetical protein JDV02_007455 [Purpureocillium takamizusanense]|uniref:Uncharacterized protein n=1 Tax=Purpureocillium takamizusanense TaxID=2060973 RepID=A0A9Q8QMF9_9HYPO|nr:uncharacterized protein JDV02_007455 [Purpureocillium takamizusanense]UNI21466.1 hypothetical protein JDV02_007455 [Purpureocillium takamizusanense]